MKMQLVEGAVRLGTAAVAVLALSLPADMMERRAPAHDEVRQSRKLDKRYMERDAFNRKMRTIAGNAGEADGAAESEDIGPTPTSAAEEKLARHAFPLGTIPAGATTAAQGAWQTDGENTQAGGNNATHAFV